MARAATKTATTKASTTGTLFKLQATLWARSLSSSPQQLVSMIIVGLFIVIQCVGLGVYGMVTYRDSGDASILVLTMAVGTLLYIASSVLSPNSETQVDPSALATLPLSAKDILPGMFLTKFLQTGSIICVLNTLVMMGIGASAFSSEGAGPVIAWLAACVGQLILTLSLGEAIGITMSRAGGSAFQERLNVIAGFVTMVAIIGSWIAFTALTNAESQTGSINFDAILPYVTWLPLGAFANAAAGSALATPNVLISIILGLSALALSMWFWYSALRSLIRNPIRHSGSSKSSTTVRGDILLPLVPPGRMGALYSQALKYWLRDSRQLMQLFTLPALAAMYLAMSMLQEESTMGWAGLILFSVSGGSLVSNIIGMDGPANWVHLSAGVTGRAFVWSRWTAAVSIIFLWYVLYAAILGAIIGYTDIWLTVSGLLLLMMLQNTALGLYIGSISASPTGPPTASAFRQKNNTSFSSAMMMLALTVVSGLLIIPGAIVFGTMNNPWIAFLVQAPITAVIVGVIVHLASKKLDDNWPELFNKVKNWV